MKDVFGLISKLFSTIGSLLLLIWKLVKYVFSKFWKFILVIVSAIASLFLAQKALKKEE